MQQPINFVPSCAAPNSPANQFRVTLSVEVFKDVRPHCEVDGFWLEENYAEDDVELLNYVGKI